jgi:hypothetical protein
VAQITKHHYQVGYLLSPGEEVFADIPAGTLPEARFLYQGPGSIRDHHHPDHGHIRQVGVTKHAANLSKWLPNSNSPLQMSHAVLHIMMSSMTRAIISFSKN